MSHPLISVVTATHDRAHLLPAMIHAVLAQADAPRFELIVVDDGSTDGTRDVLAAITDPRVRSIYRPNMGPGPARNAGVTVAHGEWLLFLDDDDRPHVDWLTGLASAFATDVGLCSCGHRVVDPSGHELQVHLPRRAGPLFCDKAINTIAGTMAMRRSLFETIGGYVVGLRLSENTDLAIRATTAASELGLRVTSVTEPLIDFVLRESRQRESTTPAFVLDASRWQRVRFPTRFAGSPEDLATNHRMAGVAAARLRRWADARRELFAASRASRSSWLRDGLRLAAACVPPLGRRVWDDAATWTGKGRGRSIPLLADLDASLEPVELADQRFLPWRYHEGDGEARHHAHNAKPVAAWAGRRLRGNGPTRVLVEILSVTDDPRRTLRMARGEQLNAGGRLVVAELDRDSLPDPRPQGPPAASGVRREWSADGLCLLVESEGFTIERRHHLALSAVGSLGWRMNSLLRFRRQPRWTVLVLTPQPITD